MLKKFKVSNFKSISELEIELGRVNVFIGENGSGKSNVLEAFAMVGGVALDRVSPEFLVPRGVRFAAYETYFSAFQSSWPKLPITLEATIEKERSIRLESYLRGDKKAFRNRRIHIRGGIDPKIVFEVLTNYIDRKTLDKYEFGKLQLNIFTLFFGEENQVTTQHSNWLDYQEASHLIERRGYADIFDLLEGYVIFSPEHSQLRSFVEEEAIRPIGKFGQGLFNHLRENINGIDKLFFEKLNASLQLFNWFDTFEVPNDLWPGENRIDIKDRFIASEGFKLDQRSTNEGFLFVLFYLTLLISKDTPRFFAIDNIETALNPKLCTKVMKTIVELAKEHDKQVIVTTHNPGVLDGLDLEDDDQRLFLIYRNDEGHTKAERITRGKPLPGYPPTKLSEAFMNGALRGLPKNFDL